MWSSKALLSRDRLWSDISFQRHFQEASIFWKISECHLSGTVLGLCSRDDLFCCLWWIFHAFAIFKPQSSLWAQLSSSARLYRKFHLSEISHLGNMPHKSFWDRQENPAAFLQGAGCRWCYATCPPCGTFAFNTNQMTTQSHFKMQATPLTLAYTMVYTTKQYSLANHLLVVIFYLK